MKLPPELLSEIFIWGFRESQPKLHPLKTEVPNYNVLYEWMLICQYWRSTVLGCPYLWNFISSSYPPERAQVLLERSKQVPIRVQPISSNDELLQNLQTLELIMKEIHRIEYLYIEITWDVAAVLANLSLSQPERILHTLNIDNRMSNMFAENVGEDVDLLWLLAVGQSQAPRAPHLSTLYLSGYTLRKLRNQCPWLIQDSIRDLFLLLYDETEADEDNSPPKSHEILELLHRMPSLEYVNIPTWLDNSTHIPPSPSSITLRNLRVLKMQLNLPDASFLKHMSFPLGVQIQIITQCHVLNGHTFQHVFEPCVSACGLATPQSSEEVVPVRSLHLQSPYGACTVKCWTTSIRRWDMEFDTVHSAGSNNPPVLELHFINYVGITITEIYSVIAQCVELSSLETLHLALAPESDPQTVKDVCRVIRSSYRMQQLYTLVATQWPLPSLYRMLWVDAEPTDANNKEMEMKFPNIRTIWTPRLPPMTLDDWVLFESILEEKSIEMFCVWQEDFNYQQSQQRLESLQSRFSALVVDDKKLSDFVCE